MITPCLPSLVPVCATSTILLPLPMNMSPQVLHTFLAACSLHRAVAPAERAVLVAVLGVPLQAALLVPMSARPRGTRQPTTNQPPLQCSLAYHRAHTFDPLEWMAARR